MFKKVPVEVKLMEISWCSNNLTEFYNYLRNYPGGDELFENKIIKMLLEQNYSDQIMLRVTMPYIGYIFVCLLYFSVFIPYSVVPKHGFFGGPGEYEQTFLRILVCIGSVVTTGPEIYQMMKQSDYLTDIWNYLIWITNLLSIFICIEQSTNVVGISRTLLIQLASIDVILQWSFAFYWVRLFPELAFYVTMVFETIKDCAYFIMILLAAIVMFGNAFYTLQGIDSGIIDGKEGQIWQDFFGHKFGDAAFMSYLIGLGEFSYENWADHPSWWLIWVYFILATFFTQIMFFNMLIAIMGETYARVTE